MAENTLPQAAVRNQVDVSCVAAGEMSRLWEVYSILDCAIYAIGDERENDDGRPSIKPALAVARDLVVASIQSLEEIAPDDAVKQQAPAL